MRPKRFSNISGNPVAQSWALLLIAITLLIGTVLLHAIPLVIAAVALLILMLGFDTLRLVRVLDAERHAATAFELEKSKIALVLSGVTDAVIVVDSERRIVVFNSAAARLTGYQESLAIGKRIESLVRIFDGVREVAPDEYCSPPSRAHTHPAFARKDLKLVALAKEAFADVVVDTVEALEHEFIGCILTFHDVTTEHLFERLKQDFVAVAAHQLRTPLTAIKWTFDLALAGDFGALSPDARMYFSRAIERTDRMVALVNDMLDIDRLESGVVRLTLAPSTLSSLVESSIMALRNEAERRGIKMTFSERPGTETKVSIDYSQMETVFRNLIENAIRYTPSGGLITLGEQQSGGYMTVWVRDTGIGIPADQQDEIFRRFFRARNAVRHETEGSGLGLYLTKSIIERHGGRIWFESEEGKGTTFYVTLPVWVE